MDNFSLRSKFQRVQLTSEASKSSTGFTELLALLDLLNTMSEAKKLFTFPE